MKSSIGIKTIGMFYHRYRDGGIERVMSLLIPMFMDMGYELVLITEEQPNSEDYYLPKEVKRITINDTWKVLSGVESKEVRKAQFKAALKDYKIDVLIYEALMSPLAFEDIQIINECGIYSVGCQHGVFCQGILEFNWNDEQIKVCKLLDRLIVLSEMEAVYWRIYGVETICIFNPMSEGLEVIPMENRKDIVWVGRFDATQKQYMDVIEIMKNVIKKCPKVKLLMYGKGTYFEENILKQAISDYKLECNIELKGYVKDVSEIFKTSIIHLVTSAFESFAMVIYESRYAGIPLVTYDMPYLELLSDNKGYISVDYKDYQKSADAIVEILQNRDLEQKLSKEAVESIYAYSVKELRGKWQNVFCELCEEKIYRGKRKENNVKVINTVKEAVGMQLKKYHKLSSLFKSLLFERGLGLIKRKRTEEMGVVIYPYGAEGRRFREYLNRHNIEVDYVIDNNVSQCDVPVKHISELAYEDTSRYLFVISNCNPLHYDLVRANIKKYVDCDNIIDIYPSNIEKKAIVEGLRLW